MEGRAYAISLSQRTLYYARVSLLEDKRGNLHLKLKSEEEASGQRDPLINSGITEKSGMEDVSSSSLNPLTTPENHDYGLWKTEGTCTSDRLERRTL